MDRTVYKITISSSLLCRMSLSVKGRLLTPEATWKKVSAAFFIVCTAVCAELELLLQQRGQDRPTANAHGSLIHNNAFTLF